MTKKKAGVRAWAVKHCDTNTVMAYTWALTKARAIQQFGGPMPGGYEANGWCIVRVRITEEVAVEPRIPIG